MFSRRRLRLRQQSRLFCGHCNEYLSKRAFWKHRKAYYDVQNEQWTTRDTGMNAEPCKQEAKRSRYQSNDSDEQTATGAGGVEEWTSNSSGDEELEEAISNEGMN